MNRSGIVLAGVLISQLICCKSGLAQSGGDQFLDGIGETALVARYVFNGSANDASRNSQHAALQGSGATYVSDAQFGRVLSLPGGDGAYVQIPGRALDGLETISVSGWIKLRSGGTGRFFDFGQNTRSNLFCVPGGTGDLEGYRAGITLKGVGESTGLVAERVSTNRWAHLVAVFDATRKSMRCYLDGKRAAQVDGVDLALEQVLNPEDGALNRAFIGRGQDDSEPRLDALVHDVRIYSVALVDQQVRVIHRNALAVEDADTNVASSGQSEQTGATRGIAQPRAALLVDVPDVSAETLVGYLPRLPYWIPGIYRDGVSGPDVRVIWPSPANNQQVLTAGVYEVVGRVPGTAFEPVASVTVKAPSGEISDPQRQLEPFPLGNVLLTPDTRQRDTPFIRNRDKFLRGLADTDPNRFLYMFRDAFGQPQPEGVEPLHGWDSQTTRLRGHATGHYLSAIAQAYASSAYDETLQANFREKMDYLIDTLHNLSRKSGTPTNAGAPFNANPTTVPPGSGKDGYDSDLTVEGIRTDYWNWGKGFISAYPPDQFIMLEQGATYGGRNNQVWAPYYTLHKILAGLLDCYEVGGNPKALAVAEGMSRWVYERLQTVSTETRIDMWNRYIAGEYGGMNEVLARLSRITGDESFMDCARLFDNVDFFFGDAQHTHGLARNVDTIRGKHANQHIPQIIGAVATYGGSGETDYWRVAESFWEICTHSYMYSIGGVAGARNPNNAECFTAQPDTLFANGFANGGQNETCATYNLLKLSRQLFLFNPDAKYMDHYEQALYNHILGSVAEDNPGNTYHVPLNPAARKHFGNAKMDGFSCCNGTALESNTKLQDTIYFRSVDGRALYVNLFVPSELRWPDQGVTLTQATDFPYGDSTTLTLGGGGTFDIKVRVPHWATDGFRVKINGEPEAIEALPGTYLTLSRPWKDGDVIEVQLPLDFRLSPVMDQPNIASLFYGPVLLAAVEPEPRSTWRPITLSDKEIDSSISGDPQRLRFQIGEARFKPFYETYDRSSVYLDVTLE